LHYFKQVVHLSATCFHVELEQFLACFRVARVCQRQLGFLVRISMGILEKVFCRIFPKCGISWNEVVLLVTS